MYKQKLFSLITVFISCCCSVIAQEYDQKLKVKITRKDIKHPTLKTVQTHEISINDSKRLIYSVKENIGFEVTIDNQSQSEKKYRYKIYFSEHNFDRATNDINGAGRPIILPPEDEDFSKHRLNYPFVPENTSLDSIVNLGNKILVLSLYVYDNVEAKFRYTDSTESLIKVIKPKQRTKKIRKNDLLLYPNTLENHLYIKPPDFMYAETDNKIKVEVFSSQGILIKQSSISPVFDKTDPYYRFINPTQKAGIYFYKITTANKTYVKALRKK